MLLVYILKGAVENVWISFSHSQFSEGRMLVRVVKARKNEKHFRENLKPSSFFFLWKSVWEFSREEKVNLKSFFIFSQESESVFLQFLFHTHTTYLFKTQKARNKWKGDEEWKKHYVILRLDFHLLPLSVSNFIFISIELSLFPFILK